MSRTIGDAMNDLWKKGIKPVDDTKAPLNSPALTGTPTAPTPAKNVSGSDRLATTAYVLSLLKNNPGIIDELLTAINGKLDKTTADSTYLTKTTADSTYLTKTTADSTYLKSPLSVNDGHVRFLDAQGISNDSGGSIYIKSGSTNLQIIGDQIKCNCSGGFYVNGTKLA